MSFSGGTMVKNPPTNAENARNQGSIRGSRRSPEGRNSNPLQDPCLENQWTSVPGGLHTVRGVAKNQIRLSNWTELNFLMSFLVNVCRYQDNSFYKLLGRFRKCFTDLRLTVNPDY